MSDYTESKVAEILSIVQGLKSYPPTRDDIKYLAKSVEELQYSVKHLSEKMESFLYEWNKVKDNIGK